MVEEEELGIAFCTRAKMKRKKVVDVGWKKGDGMCFFCRFSFGSLWMDLLKVGIYMGLWFAVIYIDIYIFICIERVFLKYCWAWDRAGDKDTYDFAGYIGGVELQTVEEGAPLGEGNWSDHARIFPSLHGLKNWFLANATVCQFSIIAIRNDHL